MINPFKEVAWSPGLVEKRKFALSLMIGFPALAVLFSLAQWLGAHSFKPFFVWMGLAGFVLGALLWLVPSIAKPFYLAWYFIACCIGAVVGNLLFCIFFFLVFTPIALMRRSLVKAALRRGFDRGAATYWQDSEKKIDIERYYRQF